MSGPNVRTILEHLDAEHRGWFGSSGTAEHDPFHQITRGELLEAHRQEHLAGRFSHDSRPHWRGPPARPRIRLAVGHEPDALASCEEWSVVAWEHGPEYRIGCTWGYAGPVGKLGSFVGYVAGEYRAAGYSVEVDR